jgi:hypothetical protein
LRLQREIVEDLWTGRPENSKVEDLQI